METYNSINLSAPYTEVNGSVKTEKEMLVGLDMVNVARVMD